MAGKQWTEDELMMVLGVYCRLTFGQLSQTNRLIRDVAERLDRTPGSVAMKLTNIASLDPAITSTGRKGLPGASALDRKVWSDFSANTETWMPIIELRLEALLGDQEADDVEDSAAPLSVDYSGNDILAVAKRRQGQNLFRQAVFSAYQTRCCITDIAEPRLLIASHIKPWREDKENRLNPRNGLCLSALVDRAFDQGMISLTDACEVMVSSALKGQADNKHIQEMFCANEGRVIRMPEKFLPDAAFLAWHRENLFLD
ncbi:HNH endonuclease [uncultured Alcanivorax sp.]|jgi:putative restriction endonuclease|uniref:HNH endonuclease n=1 Tax=uncultured Alcanivorax sp. TaxID=191215 RepID=UPI0030DCAA8A